MPIVSTHHCDIPEVVVDGVTGLLAKERDSKALADHLQTFAEEPERMRRMGEEARRHIELEYNASVQGRRLADLYDRVATK